MIPTTTQPKIDFRPVTLQDKALYERYLSESGERGCEFSFANVYLWGEQSMALLHGQLLLFARFGDREVYPNPLGEGDKKAAIDAILADAQARDIPCRISGLCAEARETLDALYPEQFCYKCSEGSFDYVYDIHDLADLKGKKYHGKRNHLHRFRDAHPNAVAVPLTEDNLPRARAMAEEWYRTRLSEDPDGDYRMEQLALDKAFCHFRELALEGLVLTDGEDVLAFTMASRLSADTFDVHFEKARADVQGAYTAINCEFARYLREKYPDVRYLDREEDMGLEGLRRAKQSYHPHHMVRKCRACLSENCDEKDH